MPKISELPEQDSLEVTGDDKIPMVDTSAGRTEFVTVENLVDGIQSAGILDHGLLQGVGDDDHSIYALAAGTRGYFVASAAPDVQATAGSSRTATLSPAGETSAERVFLWTLSESALTITLAGAPSSGVAGAWRFMLINPSATARTVAFADSITWLGGASPQIQAQADAVCAFTIETFDAGTTNFGWYDPTDTRKTLSLTFNDSGGVLATGDGGPSGDWLFAIPEALNGYTVSSVTAALLKDTSDTGGPILIQVARTRSGSTTDMLSTRVNITDSQSFSTAGGATQAVVNTASDDLLTNDILRFDIDDAGDGPNLPLQITLICAPG